MHHRKRAYSHLRGNDEQVRAFYNVCPHRGTKLVQEAAGSKKIFQCCYHGWTFKLDGKLHQAPNFKNVEGFCGDDYYLKPCTSRLKSRWCWST